MENDKFGWMNKWMINEWMDEWMDEWKLKCLSHKWLIPFNSLLIVHNIEIIPFTYQTFRIQIVEKFIEGHDIWT